MPDLNFQILMTMVLRLSLLFTIFCMLQNAALANEKTIDIDIKNDSVTVYVFLHESCIISQYYTLNLRELSNEFSNENIQFIGLFPNYSSKPEKIKEFKEKYKIPFQLKTDYDKIKTIQFEATVTPEVIVFNETQNEILYKGRIDDAYARVGRRKQVIATSELKDALTAISNHLPIEVRETTPVGCYISMRKAN